MRDIAIRLTFRTATQITQIHHEIIESLINGTVIVLQLIGELINRKTANINVKKLQFIHM